MPTVETDPTFAEIAEALGHMVAAARDAADDVKAYDVWHRRIDCMLDDLELMHGLVAERVCSRAPQRQPDRID